MPEFELDNDLIVPEIEEFSRLVAHAPSDIVMPLLKGFVKVCYGWTRLSDESWHLELEPEQLTRLQAEKNTYLKIIGFLEDFTRPEQKKESPESG